MADRAETIVNSPWAKGQEALATHLATVTDLTAAAAIEILRISARNVRPTIVQQDRVFTR